MRQRQTWDTCLLDLTGEWASRRRPQELLSRSRLLAFAQTAFWLTERRGTMRQNIFCRNSDSNTYVRRTFPAAAAFYSSTNCLKLNGRIKQNSTPPQVQPPNWLIAYAQPPAALDKDFTSPIMPCNLGNLRMVRYRSA